MTPEDFLEDGSWKCVQCGACCRVAGYLIPEWDRGDGACQHLTQDNLCGIYEVRPEICRTENFPTSDGDRALACSLLANMTEAT